MLCRTRHFVTNVRTFRHRTGELRVESALLLFRSQGDAREPDLISVGRTDLLRETGDGLRLARHEIIVDESVLHRISPRGRTRADGLAGR